MDVCVFGLPLESPQMVVESKAKNSYFSQNMHVNVYSFNLTLNQTR